MASMRINYSRVIAQANRMDDLSDDLSREIRKLQNMLGDVRSNWKGNASNTYQRQLMNLISDMQKTRIKMSNVSRTIKTAAARIKAEDERIAEASKALNS